MLNIYNTIEEDCLYLKKSAGPYKRGAPISAGPL